jgi:hypothetical protein
VSEQVAKSDYREVWMRYMRRQLAGDFEAELPDEPTKLFDDDDDQALEEAKARHPARPVQTVQSDAL